jgi:transcriptional regulator with XRE-family HTH domain
MKLSLLDDTDVSEAFAAHIRDLREKAKLSREALAKRSCVPAPTIKKFELTGSISFRQLLLLWQSLDSLDTTASSKNNFVDKLGRPVGMYGEELKYLVEKEVKPVNLNDKD